MKLTDFQIGTEFKCGVDKLTTWRCTDIGTRVIIAIKVMDPFLIHKEPDWFNGPPYAVEEVVFDEHDMPGCELCRS